MSFFRSQSRDSSADGGSTMPPAPVSAAPVAATMRPNPFGQPAGFGKPMCFVTYPGALASGAVLDPLLGGVLGARLCGPIGGNAGSGPLMLPMRSGTIVVMLMDAPLALGELTDDLAQLTAWRDWKAAARTWRSHAIVVALSAANSLASTRALAEDVMAVAGVLAARSEGSAVGWPGSGLFMPAAEFVRSTARLALPPELLFRCLWRAGDAADGRAVGAATRGLRLFGLPEIDDRVGGEDPSALYARLLNLAYHLMVIGPVLREGDTVGGAGDRPGRVRAGCDADGRPVLLVEPVDTPGFENAA